MKKRITPIPIPPPKMRTDAIESGNLPEPDAVNQSVAQLTGKTIEPPPLPQPPPPVVVQTVAQSIAPIPVQPTVQIAQEPPLPPVVVQQMPQMQPVQQMQQVVTFKTFGRPPKPEAVGRDKFTTRLKSELVVELKTRAAKRKITVADLVEMIIGDNYLRY